jgi:hypothetical protein
VGNPAVYLQEFREQSVSRGKYLNLPETRKKRQLVGFAKEHPSEDDAEDRRALTAAFGVAE